jgi:hypothetical protein
MVRLRVATVDPLGEEDSVTPGWALSNRPFSPNA